MPDMLKVTLVRSPIGRKASHIGCLRGLALKKMGQTSVIANTAENRGMINEVRYMLKVEES